MRIYKFLATVFNMKRDTRLFDDDPKLLQRSISAFQRIAPIALKQKDKFHSQFGQDILVSEVLLPTKKGVFLDVGARCGVINSNTLALEKEYGWSGALVEPEYNNYASIVAARSQPAFHVAVSDKDGEFEFCSFSEERGHSKLRKLVSDEDLAQRSHEIYTVQVMSIATILKKVGLTKVDYIDIDVEGEEVAAINGIDFNTVDFNIISVECNPRRYQEIREMMEKRDYLPLCRLGVDVFFVRRKNFANFCERIEQN